MLGASLGSGGQNGGLNPLYQIGGLAPLDWRWSSSEAARTPLTCDRRRDTTQIPMLRCPHLKDNGVMSGIQFVTDEKGRKVAVQIDLKKYAKVLEDFWDGLISESRRKEKGVPIERVKADLVKRGRLRE